MEATERTVARRGALVLILGPRKFRDGLIGSGNARFGT